VSRITIHDMEGISHSVEVTAATLYEAVARGLTAIRGHEWVAGIAQGANTVRVSVADVRVEHEVRLMDFTKWVERPGGSPREVSDSWRIREILANVSRKTIRPRHFGQAERLIRSGWRTSRTLLERFSRKD
jgi:hypothetical protein